MSIKLIYILQGSLCFNKKRIKNKISFNSFGDYTMKKIIIFICLLTISLFPQETIKKSLLNLPDKTTYKLDETNFSLPVWVTASETTAYSVHIDIANIISSEGLLKRINYKVEPESANISISKTGKLFMVRFDSSEIASLDSGSYSVISVIEGRNTEPLKTSLSFEIAPAKDFFSWLEDSINWILDHFFTLLWHLLEITLFIFVIIFIIKSSISIFKIQKKNSLNVLPLVNETGIEADFKGAAEGIDDVLIFRLQEISNLSNKAVSERYGISRVSETFNEKQDIQKINTDRVDSSIDLQKKQVQTLNVVGGEFSMDLQKIGDITIGPIKIPLGSISDLILKLFGGNFVTGALQKYGKYNRLYIKLERKTSVLTFKKKGSNLSPVQYFEARWSSDAANNGNPTEGVPDAVDELAYKLILELSTDVETKNWIAYKYFMDGYKLYSDFEKNKTRIDLLRDAIIIWRKGVKSDPDFATVYYNLGVAYEIDGNSEDALFHYQKAISLNPKSIMVQAHFNLARLFWEKYKDENRTLAELEKAKKFNPDIPDIYNLEGLVFSNRPHNYSEEAKLYQRAIDLSKENPNPVYYYNLCIAKFYLKQWEEAQTAGEVAYDLYKDNNLFRGLLQTMGFIHYQKGLNAKKSSNSRAAHSEFEKSAKYFKEGLFLAPTKRKILEGYRDTLFKLDQITKGIELFRRLIRIYPEVSSSYSDMTEYLVNAQISSEEIKIFEQIADVLEKEKDPIKINELLKGENSLLQTKIFRGISACIFNILYDPKKNPDYLELSSNIFNEIFQPEFDNIKSLIDAELSHHYGMVLYTIGKYESSIEYLSKAIEIYKNDERTFDLAQAYDDLTRIYTAFIKSLYDQYDEVTLLEARLKRIVATDSSEQMLNELKKATAGADKLFNDLVQKILTTDKIFQDASSTYQIINFKNLAVSAHLDNAKFLLTPGLTPFFKNNVLYEIAKQECNKAIMIDENNFDAYHIKGNTYYYLRQYVKAIAEYEKSIELNFNLSGSHYGIGLCYFYMDEFKEASKAFKMAIKLNPKYTFPDDMTSPDAYQRLASSLEKTGDINGAEKILMEATNIHPVKVKYHILLGQLLKGKNDLARAAEEFRNALKLDRKNEQKMQHIILAELADIYADNYTNLTTAQEYIINAKKLVKELDPEDNAKIISKIENTEGWIYYNQNQYDLSIKLLQKTLINFLQDPKYHSRLALAYQKYAESFSDENLKKEYKDKSLIQWKIIADLNVDDSYKKEAEEQITKLTKT